MNSWNFTGNIGNAAEQRHTPSGDSVVQFSVAVKSGYGEKEVTTWTKCSLWGKRGESVASYLTKGQLVGVTGEVTLREFTDKDGVKRTSLDVRVNDITLLGNKRDHAPSSSNNANIPAQTRAPSANSTDAGGGFADMADDIPFSPISRRLAMVI